jgi:TrmH family RNA methyltransferase
MMASKLITLVRNLQQRKGRQRSSLAVAEGVRLVEEVLRAEIPCKGAVVCSTLSKTARGTELLADIAAHAVPIDEVDESTFAELAGTETPQGVLVVVEPPRFQLQDIQPQPRFPVLVVDGVQDPGNLGALLRTAHGLGAPGVVLLKGTADATNAKVLRAGMGATFRLPVVRATDEELSHWIGKNRLTLWVAEADGVPLDREKPPEALAILVGNEGAGVRPVVADLASRRVAIPLARGVESLNVAVAAGILLYEVQRAG